MKDNTQDLSKKFALFVPYLDEKTKRLYAGSEALSLGRGGIALVNAATGMSRTTISQGVQELLGGTTVEPNKVQGIRKAGGGRKKKVEKLDGLSQALEELLAPHTRGDPMNPLIWTSKSLRHLEKELKKQGFAVSHRLIGGTLKALGYSLQANRKTKEGGEHIDRDAQFEFINSLTMEYLKSGNPVISVDCKKKELIGEFKNMGREWEVKGESPQVNVYDFIDKEKGKAAPYGVYDIAQNEGWVSVGISHDTAEFAVSSISAWWNKMGKENYPQANKLYINADGGGSNGSRNRLWKVMLQQFAQDTGLEIRVSHFPPGTSKWNKIEHRLFSFITMNWRAKPLVSLQTIVSLIASTTTKTGLKVKAAADDKIYQTAIKVTEEDMKKTNLTKDEFHGEWNYIINHI